MWSEENISEEFMWIKIFPQLAAVAERGWREGMVILTFQPEKQFKHHFFSGKTSGKVHHGTLLNRLHSKMILQNSDMV